MKVPFNWLKEYIDIDLPPQQIAKILTSHGLEVDAIETLQLGFENVVVGKVLQTEKHPNAEKLCIATVTDGTTDYQVVCGASNCRPGLKTAFAKVGATLTDAGKTFKVKPAKLRGVESFGMLCSGSELGISDADEGIIEFADQVQVGTDVASMYADTVFEISLTPNLVHCMNIMGVARELSAATGIPVYLPSIQLREDPLENVDKNVTVHVASSEKCPRYTCSIVKDVKVGPSPEWLVKRLESAGLRTVNNVVDITNLVLLETGQPLHAFDYGKLADQTLNIRVAQVGELFVTLDGKERKLDGEDLLICDGQRAVAIAGVMGGQNSEVGDSTRDVLIESAYFQPTSIRRTSKRLGLQTDASKRFERGANPNAVLYALDRAAMLMQEWAGGRVLKGVVDIKKGEFTPRQVPCRLSRLNALLGTHLSVTEVEAIFKRLEFSSHWDGKDQFTVKVPTYRGDVTTEIDLIEEVARIYGYDNIPRGTVKYQEAKQPPAPLYVFERKVRTKLLAEGLQEFLTCDLIGPTLLNVVQEELMPPEAIVKVLNPNSVEQSILRTSLFPGLLQVVKFNFDHQNPNLSGFEIGRIHFKEGEHYREQAVAALLLTGQAEPYHWDPKPRVADFYDLKGMVENLLEGLGVEKIAFRPSQLKIFHEGRQAAIFAGDLQIGALGEIHPSIQRRLDVPQRILFAELSLQDLLSVQKELFKMETIPQYPSSDRDWTVTLPETTPIETVLQALRNVKSKLLQRVEFIDLFRSDKLEGKKNATFHFIYRDKDKTLELEAVDKEHGRVINQVLNILEKC